MLKNILSLIPLVLKIVEWSEAGFKAIRKWNLNRKKKKINEAETTSDFEDLL